MISDDPAPGRTLKAGLTVFVHLLAVMPSLDDISIFATLKAQMSYLTDRQQLIAQNVANADTPGYTPQDLKPFVVPGQGGVGPIAPALTSAMHLMAPTQTASGAKPQTAPDSETTLDGNSVVLEEEMMKMTQARSDYDTAVTFYQQAMQMLQTAAKRPGS
jgi:flagellar basal-body rod protein FlgB